MDERIKTAADAFKYFNRYWFFDMDMTGIARMNHDEQAEYMLKLVDHLLSTDDAQKGESGADHAKWYSTEFWLSFESRTKDPRNFLFDEATVKSLTPDEKVLLDFYTNMAGLCHDLTCYGPIVDEMNIFGFGDDYTFENQKLMDYVHSSEYKYIVRQLVQIIRRESIYMLRDMHYQPAQDCLADMTNVSTIVSVEEYITDVLYNIDKVYKHISKCRTAGMTEQEIIFYDELDGGVPFYPVPKPIIMNVAKQLNEFAFAQYRKYDWSERKPDIRNWRLQPKNIRQQMNGYIDAFIEKIQEFNNLYPNEIRVSDGSLAFNYLVSHAELIANGTFDNK